MKCSNGSSLGGFVSVRFQMNLEASLTLTYSPHAVDSGPSPVGSAHKLEFSNESSNKHVFTYKLEFVICKL